MVTKISWLEDSIAMLEEAKKEEEIKQVVEDIGLEGWSKERAIKLLKEEIEEL